MKGYERKTVRRFTILYYAGFLFFFLTLASLYVLQERGRMEKERTAELRLTKMECDTLSRLLGREEAPCAAPEDRRKAEMEALLFRLVLLFAGSSAAFLLFSYLLARLSLGPVREASRTIDAFIGQVVHDLGTPVTSILLNARSLEKGLEGKEKRKAERIIESANFVLELEEELLLLAREGQKAKEAHPLRLDLFLRERLEETPLIELALEPLTVSMDKGELTRLADNLVGNALKYNREERPVIVALSGTRLTVRDQGVGIADTSRIFDPFYRERTDRKGSGLGLAVVKAVCDKWGLAVTVESKPGKGAAFTVDFASVHAG